MSHNPAPTDVSIHELLAGRWSPRAWSSEPVSREQIHAVLEAARWTPSSSNRQPWRFVIFDRNTDEAAWQRAFATLVPFNQGWNAAVPVLIAVGAETVTDKGEVNRSALYDAGAAAMSLVVQAHALGLAAHQMGGFDGEALRTSCAIPKHVELLSVIALGHYGDPATLDAKLLEREKAPRQRKPLAEVAFEGVWDGALRGI